jgi:hypothetical protein
VEATRFTSSPITSTNNHGTSLLTAHGNPLITIANGGNSPNEPAHLTVHPNTAAAAAAASNPNTLSTIINENNPNAESSFYEDQLDNELECISGAAATTVTTAHVNKNQASNSTLNSMPSNVYMLANAATNGQTKHDEFMRNTGTTCQFLGSGVASSSSNLSGSKPAKAKSGNHVSFNINNAIYTSRQETPIPISVLKQQAAVAAAAAAVANSASTTNNTNNNNNSYGSVKPILVQSASNSQYDQPSGEFHNGGGGSTSGGSVSSPLQSSLKKSSGISDLLSQYVQMNAEKDMLKQQQHQYQQQVLNKSAAMNTNNNNNNNNNFANSSSKTDTKTTIL